MFICKNCGETFEQPMVVQDDPSPAGVALPSGYYEYEYCPYCESDLIEEADICGVCGDYIENGEDFCEYCKRDVMHSYEEIFSGIMDNNLDVTERDAHEIMSQVFEEWYETKWSAIIAKERR